MSISKALKTIRLFHDITQEELAYSLHTSNTQISRIEAGERHITYNLLERYAKFFNIPMLSLVFFVENLEEVDTIPEKFRSVVADKILKIMEWYALKDNCR